MTGEDSDGERLSPESTGMDVSVDATPGEPLRYTEA